MAGYLYVVQMDVPDELEDDFNRIYDTEHIPNILTVPGVNSCTRFKLESSVEDGVVQSRGGLSLLQELRHELLVPGEVSGEDLHGDGAVQSELDRPVGRGLGRGGIDRDLHPGAAGYDGRSGDGADAGVACLNPSLPLAAFCDLL